MKTFEKIYNKLTDYEKKELMSSFLESVEIYPKEKEDGQLLKTLKFRFPIFFNGQDVIDISWDKESSVETVMLIEKK